MKKELNHQIDLFLQINTSGEEEKFGFSPEEDLTAIVAILNSSPQFNLKGLMTIGRVRTQNFESDARNSFEKLKVLKQKLDKDHKLNLKLSMGMSQDFEIAMKVGTDMVRVGTDIFGPRL